MFKVKSLPVPNKKDYFWITVSRGEQVLFSNELEKSEMRELIEKLDNSI